MKPIADSFRGLMAAVINRALADLERDKGAIKANLAVKNEAMAWINSPECGEFCHILNADYGAVQDKAAALYRCFLEKADGRGKPRTRCRRKRIQIC
jgi:hypothetical protein